MSLRYLIPTFFNEWPLTKFLFDSFEFFVEKGINITLESSRFEYKIKNNRYIVSFSNPVLEKPDKFPREVINEKGDYTGKLYIDINVTIIKERSETLKTYRTFIADIPILLGSKYTNFYGFSEEQLAKIGECSEDPFGYFIMNGKERTVTSMEKLATDIPFTKLSKAKEGIAKKTSGLYVSEVRSTSPNGAIEMTTVYIKGKTPIDGTINIIIPKKNKDYLPTEYTLRTFIELYDPTRFQHWSKYLMDIVNPFADLRTIFRRSLITKSEDFQPLSEEEISKIFLPHIPKKEDKIIFLLNMCLDVAKVSLGLKEPSNRDSYAFKRLETIGTLMFQLFDKLFKNFVGYISRNPPEIYRESLPSSYIIALDTLRRELRSSFVTSEWGATGSKKKRGVIQIFERTNLIFQYALIRRISPPEKKDSRLNKPRMLDPTTLMYICPSETPEGENAGLVKNLAISAYVTVDQPAEDVMLQLHNIIDPQGDTTIFVNQVPRGKCKGEFARNFLVQQRRKGLIHPHTSIALIKETDLTGTRKSLNIRSTLGRITRPLLIVEKDTLVLDKLKLRYSNIGFNELVRLGAIEWVDVAESEWLDIAINEDVLNNGRNYTHMEIDPTFILGVSANMMPFPQHNPGPRVTYTSTKLYQAVGIPALNYIQRDDITTMRVLQYPQKALVQTQMFDIIKFNNVPAEQNVVIMFGTFQGYNIDDAIVVNKSSIERGLFNSTTYTVSDIAPSISAISLDNLVPERETITRRMTYSSPVETDIFGNPLYDRGTLIHFDPETGLYTYEKTFTVAKRLKNKDPLARIIFTNKEGLQIPRFERYTGPFGVVDKIFLKGGKTIATKAKIRIRTQNIPELGDKLFAPYSQKGVIGMIVPQEDMPFTEDGISPDIIVNPHAFPSRMTAGFLLEPIIGKAMTIAPPTTTRFIKEAIIQSPIFNEVRGTPKLSLLPKRYRDAVRVLYKIPTGEIPIQYFNVRYEDLDEVTRNSIFILLHPRTLTESQISRIISVPILNEYRDRTFGSLPDKVKEVVLELQRLLNLPQIQEAELPEDLYEIKYQIKERDYNNVTLQDLIPPYNIVFNILWGESGMKREISLSAIVLQRPIYFLLQSVSKKILEEPIFKNVKKDSKFYIRGIEFDDRVKEALKLLGIKEIKELMYPSNNFMELNETYRDVYHLLNPVHYNQLPDIFKAALNVLFPNEKSYLSLKVFKQYYTLKNGVSVYKASLFDLPYDQRKVYQMMESVETIKYLGDASAFRQVNMEEIQRYMRDRGFSETSSTVYLGTTGELYQVPMFFGVTSYHVMKQMAKDKLRAVNKGIRDPVTRQPIGKKKSIGALRFGEQEVDLTKVHGAASFLRERLRDASDLTEVVACKTCGMFCWLKRESPHNIRPQCNICRGDIEPLKLSVPYSYCMLNNYMIAMGIKPKMSFSISLDF